MSIDIKPGDVLGVRTPDSASWLNRMFGRLIRFGAEVHNEPNLSNHIVVADHYDAHGTLWGIEGRPGGVGWTDCGQYLSEPLLVTNADQPKTEWQRATVCATMQALIGTGYDWQAIINDGLTDAGVVIPGWQADWNGTVPGHVVCSSLADYAYTKAGLASPPGGRGVTPADWDAFIVSRAWLA